MSSPWKIILPTNTLFLSLTKILTNHDSLQVNQRQNGSLTISMLSLRYERNLSFREKMSLFTACRKKGSITAETAAVLPLFLFFFLSVFVFFQVLHVQGSAQASLTGTAKELAVLSYSAEEEHEVLGSAYVYGKLLLECPPSYLKQMGVLYGAAGMSIAGSRIREEMELIDLRAEFQIWNLFPIPVRKQIGGSSAACARAWTGADRFGAGAGNTDGDVVYKTVNGDVYHTDPGCSYLNPSIVSISGDQVGKRRNSDGEKYKRCELCPKGAAAVVYITDTGNRYHTDLGCSGLKRTILAVPREDVGNCRPCSRCGGVGR